ncbi:Transposase [Lacticaseibacillus paracasei subsp. paracasei]|uniref:Transposase n=1 Tax=Lacticaseibacillus paracasei subsp. paracasei TaxID=47714 RepID=A0AAP9HII5_LACPA|nr:Transposase [Lacticaseibacillus paracasei subsp. paracasei]
MKLAYERLPFKAIGRLVGTSACSVQRIFNVHLKVRAAQHLPTNLCFE